MADPGGGTPGPNHRVERVGDAFHLRATRGFANRYEPPVWAALLLVVGSAVPITWLALMPQPVWSQVVLWGLLVGGSLYLLATMLPLEEASDPLVVTPGGQIEFRGVELHPGPVERVRVVKRESYDIVDTFHVECGGPTGVIVLPGPWFAGEGSEAALLPLAGWLADLFGLPRPASGETLVP